MAVTWGVPALTDLLCAFVNLFDPVIAIIYGQNNFKFVKLDKVQETKPACV